MAAKRGSRTGVTQALIKSKWYEVVQINAATQKAIVLDDDGKQILVDLREITNYLTDVSESDGKTVSAKVFRRN